MEQYWHVFIVKKKENIFLRLSEICNLSKRKESQINDYIYILSVYW